MRMSLAWRKRCLAAPSSDIRMFAGAGRLVVPHGDESDDVGGAIPSLDGCSNSRQVTVSPAGRGNLQPYPLTEEYATTPRRSRFAASRATVRRSPSPAASATWSARSSSCFIQRTKSPAARSVASQDVVELVALGPAVRRPREPEVGLVELVEVVVALQRVEVGPDRDHVGQHLLDLTAGDPGRGGVVGPARLVDQGRQHRGETGRVEAVPQPGAQRLGGEQVHLVVDAHQRPATVGHPGRVALALEVVQRGQHVADAVELPGDRVGALLDPALERLGVARRA